MSVRGLRLEWQGVFEPIKRETSILGWQEWLDGGDARQTVQAWC
jgi:hypothetical protein